MASVHINVNRRKVVGCALLLLLMGMTWLFVFWAREPVRAVTAMDQVDIDRLPELVQWLKYEKSPRRRKLDAFAARLPSRFGLNWLKAWLIRDRGNKRLNIAMDTLRHLGPRAEPIIPQLTLIMKDRSPEISDTGIYALSFVGKAAVPALLRARSDPAQLHKVHITRVIGMMGREVTPVLVECAHNEDVSLAVSATIVLAELRFEPELVVPELMNGLTNHECTIRGASAHALGHFGEAGRPAVPLLLEVLDDPDEYARRSAEFALQTIAPEELEKDRKTRTHEPPRVLHPIDYARWHEGDQKKNVQRKVGAR